MHSHFTASRWIHSNNVCGTLALTTWLGPSLWLGLIQVKEGFSLFTPSKCVFLSMFLFCFLYQCSTSALSWPLVAVSCSGPVSPCWSPLELYLCLLFVMLLPLSCLGGKPVGARPLLFHPGPHTDTSHARLLGVGDFSHGDTYHRGKADRAVSGSTALYMHLS